LVAEAALYEGRPVTTKTWWDAERSSQSSVNNWLVAERSGWKY
jgi:hypothetical protein